mmetsp:Transcript_34710/g.98799  ORF Transcript_34710/g.98799 Transcript_34710/m.98799 type:complete len:258 (+) Transcript_34710:155-928(+)
MLSREPDESREQPGGGVRRRRKFGTAHGERALARCGPAPAFSPASRPWRPSLLCCCVYLCDTPHSRQTTCPVTHRWEFHEWPCVLGCGEAAACLCYAQEGIYAQRLNALPWPPWQVPTTPRAARRPRPSPCAAASRAAGTTHAADGPHPSSLAPPARRWTPRLGARRASRRDQRGRREALRNCARPGDLSRAMPPSHRISPRRAGAPRSARKRQEGKRQLPRPCKPCEPRGSRPAQCKRGQSLCLTHRACSTSPHCW